MADQDAEPAAAATAVVDGRATPHAGAAPEGTPVRTRREQLRAGRDRAVAFSRSPDAWPFGIVAAFALAWALRFGGLVILRHDRYASFDFDAGIFGQAAWLFAHGAQFDTVRGLPLMGHHVTLGFYLFAPFYWVGLGGQTLLNVSQVLALAAVAPVTYWVGRRIGLEPWIAAAAGGAALLHFSTSWLAWELFHPEVFAIAPLIAAVGFAQRDQVRPYWAMLLGAVIWKEDIALAIAGIGIVLVLGGRRRLGVPTAAFGVTWFLVATQVVLPWFSPTGEAFYAEGFYGDLGNSFTDIAKTFVTNPTRVWQHLDRADALGHVRDLWAPFGYVNLLAPATVLIALPQLLANLLSVNGFTWDLRYHYVAMPLTAAIVGLLFALGRLRGSWRAFAAGIALAASIATALSWGVGPYSRHYGTGYWPHSEHTHQRDLDRAVAMVPSGASVSASYHLVPHLANRELVFSFPNPWKPRNWGIADRDQRDPSTVDWLVVMLSDLGAQERQLFESVIGDEAGFETVYRTPGVVVARRLPAR
jgi:uncharacterized membrane protein